MGRNDRRILAAAGALAAIVVGSLILHTPPQREVSRPALPMSEAPVLDRAEPAAPHPPRSGPASPREELRVAAAAESTPGPLQPPTPLVDQTLRVNVLDPWDRPVQHVEVLARPSKTEGAAVVGSRGEDGAFSLRLPLGVPHRLEAEPGAFYRSLFESAVQEPVYSDWGEVTVRLTPKGCRVSGRVVAAETGEPLPSAAISCRTEDGIDMHGLSELDGGRFDLMVHAGDLRLDVASAGRMPETRLFRLDPGEWIRDLEFRLAPPSTALLVGLVRSREGTPLAGAKATVAFIGPIRTGDATVQMVNRVAEAVGDAQGRFLIAGVPLGLNALYVSAEGYEPTGSIPLWVRGEREEVEVILARAGRVRVRGVGPEGSPRTPDEVALRRGDELVLRVRAGFVRRLVHRFEMFGTVVIDRRNEAWGVVDEKPAVDEDGFLVIEGIPPGEYEVSVTVGERVGRAPAQVAAGETAVVEVPLGEPR